MSSRRYPPAVAVLAILCAASCNDISTPVDDSTPARVIVSPDSVHVLRGAFVQLTANVQNRKGATLYLQPAWSVSDTALATISESGRLQARALGTVAVHARLPALSGQAVVVITTVDAPKTLVVTLAPAHARLAVGATAQFAAGGAPAFTWSVADTAVATVSQTGLVTARRIGQTTVTATSSTDSNVRAVAVVTVE